MNPITNAAIPTETDRNSAVEDSLLILKDAHHYKNWLFSIVEPYLGNKILELGSGIGNYSQFLLDREYIWMTDYDGIYLNRLRAEFGHYEHVEISHFDLTAMDEGKLTELQEQGVDTFLMTNVLEHIEDDEAVVETLGRYANPGGRLVIEVPAMQSIFGTLDTAFGHYRRYTEKDVKRLANVAGLTVETFHFYNMLSVPGWYFYGKIAKSSHLSALGTRVFNQLVPLVRPIEKRFHPPFGLSMLLVLRNDKS